MEMADHLVADGFKDVGYEYVNIDVSDGTPNHSASHKELFVLWFSFA